MNYNKLEELLQLLKDIPDSGKRDRILQLCLNTAADSIDENVLQELIGNDDNQSKNQTVFLKFTNKELSKMPIRFRKELIINDRLVRCRKRISGRKTINYEIRYRRHGYNIAVSSNDLEKAKDKFIEALKTANSGDMGRYKNHILPHFGSKPLKKITASDCQTLLDKYVEKGMGKTADEIHSLLNCIFKMAIAHNLITQNPLAIVVHSEHERTHGKALTKREERELLDGLKGTRYLVPFAVALYTGMRPNEYKTAKIQGDFIIMV